MARAPSCPCTRPRAGAWLNGHSVLTGLEQICGVLGSFGHVKAVPSHSVPALKPSVTHLKRIRLRQRDALSRTGRTSRRCPTHVQVDIYICVKRDVEVRITCLVFAVFALKRISSKKRRNIRLVRASIASDTHVLNRTRHNRPSGKTFVRQNRMETLERCCKIFKCSTNIKKGHSVHLSETVAVTLCTQLERKTKMTQHDGYRNDFPKKKKNTSSKRSPCTSALSEKAAGMCACPLVINTPRNCHVIF